MWIKWRFVGRQISVRRGEWMNRGSCMEARLKGHNEFAGKAL